MENFLEQLPSWVWWVAFLVFIGFLQRRMDILKAKDDEAVFALEESGDASQAEQLILFRINELKVQAHMVMFPLYGILALLVYAVFGG
jgi:hypothetical protein